MKRLLIVPVLMGVCLSGCKINLKADDEKKPPVAYTREIVGIPQGFNQIASNPAGAVRNSTGEVIAIGTTRDGEVLLSKFDAGGNLITSFGDHAVYRPFANSFRAQAFTVRRIVVAPEGYLIMASYGRSDVTTGFFVFKVNDIGYLDISFGPLKTGVIREEAVTNIRLREIAIPLDQNGFYLVNLTYDNVAMSSTFSKMVRFHLTGREPMNKISAAVPAACEMLNHSTFMDGVLYEFIQTACSGLTFHYQSNLQNQTLQVPSDGTILESAFLGEFGLHYENSIPMITSRDLMGNVKNEYVRAVKGANQLCGTFVNSATEYLVFSKSTPGSTDWLVNCWFL